MIYEAAILAKADLDEPRLTSVKTMFSQVVEESKGSLLVNEDWGVRTLAQVSEKGVKTGHFLYFMYQADGAVNAELTRKLGISEDVHRSTIIQLGQDSKKEAILKAFKSPFKK
jgi:small subunit ribosomal protein S6